LDSNILKAKFLPVLVLSFFDSCVNLLDTTPDFLMLRCPDKKPEKNRIIAKGFRRNRGLPPRER